MMEKYVLPLPPDPEVFREADEIELEIGRLTRQDELRERTVDRVFWIIPTCFVLLLVCAWRLNFFSHVWNETTESWLIPAGYLYLFGMGFLAMEKNRSKIRQLSQKASSIRAPFKEQYRKACLEVIDAYYRENLYGKRLSDDEWETHRANLKGLIKEANMRIHGLWRMDKHDHFQSYNSYLWQRDSQRGRSGTKAVSYSRAGVQRSNRLGPTQRVKSNSSFERQYVFDHAARIAVGEAGEKHVVSSEKKRLQRLGRPDLASKVQRVSESHGDGLGYDVISYTKEGIPKFIEVKATKGDRISEFFISRNELEFMRPGKGIEKWLFLVCLGDPGEGPTIKRISAKRFNASAVLEVVEYACTYTVQESSEGGDSEHKPG